MNLSLIKNTYTYKIFSIVVFIFLEKIKTIGDIGIQLIEAIKTTLKGDIYPKMIMQQSSKIGVDTLPMSLSMTFVAGAIIALQVAFEMVKQGAGNYVGSLVAASIVREIGPIMAGFAIISMMGSSMAAEIGTMKTTEQIDAIKTLKINPSSYLIAPRIIAGCLTIPFVVILANITGIIGGLVSSTLISELSISSYLDSVKNGLAIKDIIASIVKGFIFGGIIALISSSMGYTTKGGSKGVGESTTKAVVWSFVAIVILNYIISLIFFN